MAKPVLFKDLENGKRFRPTSGPVKTVVFLKLEKDYELQGKNGIVNVVCLETGCLSEFKDDMLIQPQ